MNSGDTAFMLVSAALVMLMTPGLALFYGGMVRSKNVLGTIMENFILLGVISVLWAIYGYSLAFGPDVGHFIGNLDWVGLAGVGFEPFKAYSETIPHQTFMIYQAMFAIITPALITGAFAERMKFSAFLVFMVLCFIRPERPSASCAVDTPTAASVPMALGSARLMLRTTTGFISESPPPWGTAADRPRRRSSARRYCGCPACRG